MELILAACLTLGLIMLELCSLNLALLILARFLAPKRALPSAELPPTPPHVLIQLPLFNEGELIDGLLAAIGVLDWPRERLHIQVLDDSIDGSLRFSERAVADMQRQGFNIELLHRERRKDFKAGALAAGLARSEAPFVAIFDADFRPAPDFLHRALRVLSGDSDLAFVQARWAHSNREESLLTRAQARLLDAHFRVEQEARWRLGLPVPFNGTCGIWRRAAIEAAGGWQGDTLTEDLDLSLRARLRGWRSAYLVDLTVPGLLPSSACAWRAQQFRWTKGFAQCALKLYPRLWKSQALPFWQKLMISVQLAQPFAFLVGATCLIMGLPFIAGEVSAGAVLGVVAIIATALGPTVPTGFLTAAGVRSGVRETVREVAGALLFTSGLLISNARAALEALLGHRSDFVRTPKVTLSTGVRRRIGRAGLLELGAGLALLGFVLLEQPLAAVYFAMLIGGLLGLGILQLRDGLAAAPRP